MESIQKLWWCPFKTFRLDYSMIPSKTLPGLTTSWALSIGPHLPKWRRPSWALAISWRPHSPIAPTAEKLCREIDWAKTYLQTVVPNSIHVTWVFYSFKDIPVNSGALLLPSLYPPNPPLHPNPAAATEPHQGFPAHSRAKLKVRATASWLAIATSRHCVWFPRLSTWSD